MPFSVRLEENLHRPGQVPVYHKRGLLVAGDTLTRSGNCPFNLSSHIREAGESVHT